MALTMLKQNIASNNSLSKLELLTFTILNNTNAYAF